MAKDHADADLDRELEDLPAELRWLEWMRRIEAVLFASASPVVTVPSLIRIAFKIIVCFQRHDVPLIFILYR